MVLLTILAGKVVFANCKLVGLSAAGFCVIDYPLAVGMRKRSTAIFVVVALLVVASVVIFRLRTRQIMFDSVAWLNGDAKLRYRMKDSLEAKYRAGELPTRGDVDRLLGPDDDRIDALEYRSFGLTQWDGNPWYLRILFNEQGKTIEFSAHAS
jgi:hypothetical protein